MVKSDKHKVLLLEHKWSYAKGDGYNHGNIIGI